MSHVSDTFFLDTAGCAPITHQTNCGWCGFHPLQWVSTAAAHLSVNTSEGDEGRWKTAEVATSGPVFPQIKATPRFVGKMSGGRRREREKGGGVDVHFHAVAALLLIPTVDWQ